MITVDTESFFAIVVVAAVSAITVAGMIVRLAVQGHELQIFEPKLTAVGFGSFAPFFFVPSGISFAALAFYGATELPLIVAITTIATETGHLALDQLQALVDGHLGRTSPDRLLEQETLASCQLGAGLRSDLEDEPLGLTLADPRGA
jgi:hypothetical protein